MENPKELKEKLMTANSEEEIKALLGEEITEEEAAVLFQEIRKRKEAGDLKALDDDNLEDVAGGMCGDVGAPPNGKFDGWFKELLKWLFGD